MRSDTLDAVGASAGTADAGRVGLACAIGTAIERYDFFIYGTAAAVVFGPQFFPQVSELAGRLAAFATFALGFIAQPLGGLVMGHLGDRVGRKTMLVWSLLLMGVATFCIGLLPNYSQIGIWAPLALVALRVLQGFALGGEWAGAVLMSVEHAPRAHRGRYGGYVALGLPTGLLLANLVFLLVAAGLPREQFVAWSWRVPFLASALLVVLGLVIRIRLSETPVFTEMRSRHAQLRVPLLHVLRNHWRTVLLCAGSFFSSAALGYVATVYFVAYATRELALPLTTALIVLVCSAAVLAASVALFARWSDRWPRGRVLISGLGALCLWSLLFFPLIDTGSVQLIALAVCGMMFLQGPYLGTQPAVFAELFPANVRYSGASLSQTIGTIAGGAPAPVIAATLFGLTASSQPITAYLVALSIVSWLCGLGVMAMHRRASLDGG